MIVGPTKLAPRDLKSLEIAWDISDSAGSSRIVLNWFWIGRPSTKLQICLGEAVFFGEVQIDASEGVGGFDFRAVAHDALVQHQLGEFPFVVADDDFRAKPIERRAKSVALAKMVIHESPPENRRE